MSMFSQRILGYAGAQTAIVGLAMNRTALQQLAESRILEAKVLLAAQLWSGAYHLAGYCVECALKSCVLVRIERDGVIFEDKKFSEQCWTHDLIRLVKLAALDTARDADAVLNPARWQNWLTVQGWNEESRYHPWTRQDAERIVNAIDDPADGVLPWIKNHW